MFDVKTSQTKNDGQSKALYELAILFQYPDQNFARKLEETSLLIGSAAMAKAKESLSKYSLSQLEEVYTRTFDVAPLAAPYLSAYIYGDENFDRGALLSKLATRFQEVGFDFSTLGQAEVLVIRTFTVAVLSYDDNLCIASLNGDHRDYFLIVVNSHTDHTGCSSTHRTYISFAEAAGKTNIRTENNIIASVS